MTESPSSTEILGPNAWLVDEMYEQYLADPASVSESWRDFFADYQRDADVVASAPDKSLPATGRTGDTGVTAVAAVAAVRDGQGPGCAVTAVAGRARVTAVAAVATGSVHA